MEVGFANCAEFVGGLRRKMMNAPKVTRLDFKMSCICGVSSEPYMSKIPEGGFALFRCVHCLRSYMVKNLVGEEDPRTIVIDPLGLLPNSGDNDPDPTIQ